MILKILNEKKPAYIAVVFDTKGPTFRHERYAEYKANRSPMPEDLVVQIPYIKRIVQALGIKILETEGVEADDVIGTISNSAEKGNRASIIISSDKDFYQLLSPLISMWDTMKDIIIGPQQIEERFGVPPEKVLDIQALMGDSSDNIPGVSGVGEKTAIKLIAQFDDLNNLLQNIDMIKQPKLKASILSDVEKVRLGKELMTIKKSVPVTMTVEDLKLEKQDTEELTNIFMELDFQRLLEQIQKKEDVEKTFDVIDDIDKLSDLIEKIKSSQLISIDLETTSTDPMRAKIIGLSVSCAPKEAVYIPVGHKTIQRQLPLDEVLRAMKPVFESETVKKVGQNIKYDYMIFLRYGVKLEGIIFDTMVGSYLINPDRYAHSLDNMAREFLGEKLISYKDLVGKGDLAPTFEDLPIDKASAYGGQDADVTLRLYFIIKNIISERDLSQLMEEVELP